MNLPLILFYGFGFVLLASALAVVLMRNPVHAALMLVLSFVTASGLWLLLYAEFLAITLVLVYVGAVMVLFLFVVMMLDVNIDKLREGFWGNLPLAALVGLLVAGEMAVLVWRGAGSREPLARSPVDPGFSNTKALGRVIYTEYVYAFELAAIILLVAIVAAIAITLRRRKETKYQTPSVQLAATPGNRLRIVKMASESAGSTPPPQPSPKGEGANVANGSANGGRP